MRLRLTAALAVGFILATARCDGGLEPEPICAAGLQGVCGTLRFRGEIPESTDAVFVAAYATFPETCNDVIFQRQPLIPPSVPHTDSIAPYSLPLPAGTYEWVLAVWKKQGQLTLSVNDTALLRVAGYYRDPADTTLAGAVAVASQSAAGDVDFVAHFDALRPATDFVTCSVR